MLANAFFKLGLSNLDGSTFNLGAGKPQSINYLVKLLKGDFVYIPKRSGEPDCTWADISEIKNKLNWKPLISFEQGVEIILNNLDYWKDAPLWDPNSISKATSNWFKYM